MCGVSRGSIMRCLRLTPELGPGSNMLEELHGYSQDIKGMHNGRSCIMRPALFKFAFVASLSLPRDAWLAVIHASHDAKPRQTRAPYVYRPHR